MGVLSGFVIFVIIFLLFVLIIIGKSIRIVPQAKTMVVERLGKFHRVLNSGLNFIFPIIDKPREIEWNYVKKLPNGQVTVKKELITLIDLRENVYDFPRQNVITKDNVVIEIDAIIYYQITDPKSAVYEIANLPDAIEKLAKTTLRSIIGEMDLDQTLSSREEINNKLRRILDEATDKWGVKVNRVEIQDINPPKDIKDAMEKQMRAERDRRAAILTAEGEKQARILESEGVKQAFINKAEGEKQAKILSAEGEAQAKIRIAEAEALAITKVTEAIKSTKADPAQYLIALKYIEALKDISSGKENKVVFLPFEATSILSSIGTIKELFESYKK
ncbi:MAG: SPFH/Band 7/PHB domain protein [Spirochaetes bacterium]|nr:SPFH/Band 7/PHB domain protein [Spirochaetota bacterium]